MGIWDSRTLAIPALLCCGLLGAAAMAGCSDEGASLKLADGARIDVTPTSIIFGDVARGGLARRNLTVRHTGTGGTVRLSNIRLETDSPDLSIELIEKTTLEPGESARIQITYRSDNDPPDDATLVIDHNTLTRQTRVPIATPGQRAQLISSPPVLDFSVVQAGAPKRMALDIVNLGTAPATITGFVTEEDWDEDFQVEIPDGLVVPVEGRVTVWVTYAPENRNQDVATLTLLTDRDDVSLIVPLYGEEETPILVAYPSLVQLGWAKPGEVRIGEVVLTNEGNTELLVTDIYLKDAPGSLTLTNRPTSDFVLAPEESFALTMLFAPVEVHPMTAEPLAYIVVESNDEARNPYGVPVHGAAGEPSLRVIPASSVDFAYVAQGFSARREVVVINEGNAAVTLTAAKLVDPTTDEFSFVNADVVPALLNPGETATLELAFDNRNGAAGTEYSKFILNSDDPVVPEYPLDVVARRAQRPTCEAAFVPELLAMGPHRPGELGTSTMRVVNFGSGNCEYREYEFKGCLAVPAGVRVLFECDNQIAFNPFEIVSAPASGTIIGPGESLNLDVTFNAPNVRNGSFGRDSYYARLALILHDPNSNRFEFVAPPGGWGRGVNVRAETAVPVVAVEPPHIEFGTVRTDCKSETRQIRVAATGPLDATISQVELVGCGADVEVDVPNLPITVPGFGSTFIDIHFAPDTIGDKSCTVRVHNDSSNLPIGEVLLTGRGTDQTHVIDSFTQIPPSKVDVLFIVDDSYSMGDDQVRLKQELPTLVDIAVRWGQDYHLAVATTDTILKKGLFQGFPRFATSATDPALFAANLVVGTQGYWEEMGLEASHMALFERSVLTDIACENVPNACPSDDGAGIALICVEGFCGGRNRGFLRDDAQLVIIMVSDEEDASTRPVPYYINALASLKTPGSGAGVVVHAIVTPAEGCLGGFGTVGWRYMQVVDAFGGHTASICGDDFGQEFIEVGEQTFGLSDRFYPTNEPAPGSLIVRVDGTVCDADWSWNSASGAVVFERGGACFPDFNEVVEIEYDVYCAAAAN